MEESKREGGDISLLLINSMSPFFVHEENSDGLSAIFLCVCFKVSARGDCMKKYSSIIILIFLSISFSIFSCSDSEKRLSPLLNQTKVILDLGHPSGHTAYDSTIWDKIRRFFIRDAIAQSAPAAFSSILVRVTGPGIGITEQSFLPSGPISLNVLSGSFRQFDVTAFVAPGSPSAALSFRGLAIANLPAGETVSVPVVMALNETKVVLGDVLNSFSVPGRIVMIDNLSTPNWTVLTESMLIDAGYSGSVNSFRPYDISFDSRGRMYIANYSPSSAPNLGVIRIDDINATNLIQTGSNPFIRFGENIGSVVTIAVDRVQNKVYFGTQTQIFQSDLDGSNTVFKTPTAMTTPIRGLDVGTDGMLYVVAGSSAYKYNWQTDTILGSLGGLNTPFDVITRPPYVYVANSQNLTGRQIIQLFVNTDNSFSINAYYGNQVSSTNTNPAMFYGAHRFAAIRNDGIFIADCLPPNGMELAKLVFIQDIMGNGWSTFGTTGIGANQFRFFSGC